MLTSSTRLAIGAALVMGLGLVALFAHPHPRAASADEPVITYMFPHDGDVFSEPLQVIQICFQEPIDVRDLPPRGEGDFDFDLTRPSGFNLGMRIVFQANGYGVAIYPGIAEEDEIIGEWTFAYNIRDRASLDPLSGAINFEVREDGQPIITPTPQMCPASGATFGPTDAPTAGPDGTPADGGSVEDDGGDSDVLGLSLLTIGVAAGAGALLVLGYVFRRRIGWWLHDPKDEPDSGDHH